MKKARSEPAPDFLRSTPQSTPSLKGVIYDSVAWCRSPAWYLPRVFHAVYRDALGLPSNAVTGVAAVEAIEVATPTEPNNKLAKHRSKVNAKATGGEFLAPKISLVWCHQEAYESIIEGNQ